MAITTRRVIAGLNPDGRSAIVSDQTIDRFDLPDPARPVLWSTAEVPADNDEQFEPLTERSVLELFMGGGSFITVSEMQPGETGRMHETDSLDFIIVLTGRVRFTTETDDVVLGPGDVLIDRGVAHSWATEGDEPMTFVCVVLAAKPLAQGHGPHSIHGGGH